MNETTTFPDLVREELHRAHHQHPPLKNLHEASAVICEEFDEFWDQVRKREGYRDDRSIVCELMQIAAMCQRTAEDLDYCVSPDALLARVAE